MHTHDKKQPATYLAHITDTTDDFARLKINAAYAKHGGGLGLRADIVDFVAAESTLKIGVLVSEQVHNTERPKRLVLAVNCAPPDKKDGTKDNARNDFFFAELKGNAFVGGTLNGLELSYVKDEIVSLYRLTTTNSRKSQFRSLEILPEHIVKFTLPQHREQLIKNGIFQRVHDFKTFIPNVPDISHVIEVDNFCNVKWLPSEADRKLLEQNALIDFKFSRKSLGYLGPQSKDLKATFYHAAQVTPTLFAAPLGTTLVAQNSSSRGTNGRNVPIIATIRDYPAESKPNYPLPQLGQVVEIKPRKLALA